MLNYYYYSLTQFILHSRWQIPIRLSIYFQIVFYLDTLLSTGKTTTGLNVFASSKSIRA